MWHGVTLCGHHVDSVGLRRTLCGLSGTLCDSVGLREHQAEYLNSVKLSEAQAEVRAVPPPRNYGTSRALGNTGHHESRRSGMSGTSVNPRMYPASRMFWMARRLEASALYRTLRTSRTSRTSRRSGMFWTSGILGTSGISGIRRWWCPPPVPHFLDACCIASFRNP